AAGNDTVSYEHASGPVTASLDLLHSNAGAAAGDTYHDIRNLTGSAPNDTLYGDTQDNILMGGAGADTLYGGGGNDTASYKNAASGVIATLDDSLLNFQDAFGGDAAGDRFNGIKNLTGSDHNDSLYGNSDANTLIGGLGDDTLSGYGGDDTIDARQGHDTAYGGDGNDTFHVSTLAPNLPTLINGGTNSTFESGNVMVLQGLVGTGSYNMATLASVTTNIDTLDIHGDAANTQITITSQDIQHMVNNGNASQLTIKADSGDFLTVSLTGTQDAVTGPTVIDADGAHTDYTIFTDDSHTQQIAQIHWHSA